MYPIQPGSIVTILCADGAKVQAKILTCTVGENGPLWYRVSYWAGNARQECDVSPSEISPEYSYNFAQIGFVGSVQKE